MSTRIVFLALVMCALAVACAREHSCSAELVRACVYVCAVLLSCGGRVAIGEVRELTSLLSNVAVARPDALLLV